MNVSESIVRNEEHFHSFVEMGLPIPPSLTLRLFPLPKLAPYSTKDL